MSDMAMMLSDGFGSIARSQWRPHPCRVQRRRSCAGRIVHKRCCRWPRVMGVLCAATKPTRKTFGEHQNRSTFPAWCRTGIASTRIVQESNHLSRGSKLLQGTETPPKNNHSLPRLHNRVPRLQTCPTKPPCNLVRRTPSTQS